jgi:uncharacterized protein HemX
MVEAAALIISATAATASAVNGVQANRQQKRSLERQRQQQAEAQRRAINERTTSAMQEKALRQNEPDISALLSSSLQPTTPSLLAGPTGVDPSKLKLGKAPLLGE